MKENINEHDMTKKMMSIIRGGYKSKLNEAEQNDTLDVKKGDTIYNDELKKLQDIVNPQVDITNFKIYPSDDNVMIEGVFMRKEEPNSGIFFKMGLKTGEIETTMNGVDLNDEVSDLLNKLKGYYQVWVGEWAKKINEYKTKQT
jgi:type II secretory pathway component PulC